MIELNNQYETISTEKLVEEKDVRQYYAEMS